MDLNDYQKQVDHHAFYPEKGTNLAYPLLGLAGEAGEVCNAFKKILRERRDLTNADRLNLAEELGDILWYVAAAAQEIGWDLDQIAAHNLAKLERRKRAREARAQEAA